VHRALDVPEFDVTHPDLVQLDQIDLFDPRSRR
jgi:hypothetical protein